MAVYCRDDSWIADFYIGGANGRRMRRSTPTKELAKAIERDAKVKEMRGEVGMHFRCEITLKAFITRYKRIYSPAKTQRTRQLDGFLLKHITDVNRELDLIKSLMSRGVGLPGHQCGEDRQEVSRGCPGATFPDAGPGSQADPGSHGPPIYASYPN